MVTKVNLLSASAKQIKANLTITTPSHTLKLAHHPLQNTPACRAASRLFADFTSKIRTIGQLGVFTALGQNADDTVLDKVHLLADGSLPDYVVAWLEDLKAQFGQH